MALVGIELVTLVSEPDALTTRPLSKLRFGQHLVSFMTSQNISLFVVGHYFIFVQFPFQQPVLSLLLPARWQYIILESIRDFKYAKLFQRMSFIYIFFQLF